MSVAEELAQAMTAGTGVHLVAAAEVPASLSELLPSARWTLFDWSLAGCTERGQLFALAASTLGLPEVPAGFDPLLDLLTDLEIPDTTEGVVLSLRHLEDLYRNDKGAFEDLVYIMPYLADRWISRIEAFHVVIVAGCEVGAASTTVLEQVSRDMESARRKPWLADLGPVPLHSYGCQGRVGPDSSKELS